MHIEFDGPVSTANSSTIRQVIEALLTRIQARDEDLDLTGLSRVLVTDDLAAAERRFGVTPSDRLAPVPPGPRRRRPGPALRRQQAVADTVGRRWRDRPADPPPA